MSICFVDDPVVGRTTDQIDTGATVTVSCLSAETMPKNYDTVTINDGF